jgi:lipopolysaccharide heptosyltransferase I
MRRSRPDLSTLEPGRVVLIKPSSLGDVVHALPALAALRERWPRAHIAWVINSGLRGLVEGHPLLDAVIPFDRSTARISPAGLASLGRFLRDLRRRRFDLVIDLQGLLRSGAMTLAAGAPVRVGLADAREKATLAYTHRVAPSPDRPHAVDRLLAVAAAFGADVSRPRFVLATSDADRSWAREALAGIARPLLVLNVGARWITKRWPPAHFAEVARRAVEMFGAGLLALGAVEDRPLVEALRARVGRIPVLDLCGRTTLGQLAAVAAEADLFLSNDTGPLHLAAATGTRVVGIYTCTRPEWTGPYGPDAVALSTRVACAGSCLKTCRRLDCMSELTPDRVWPAVREGLGGAMRARPGAA